MRPASQSVSQSINQSASQSVSQSASQPASQSDRIMEEDRDSGRSVELVEVFSSGRVSLSPPVCSGEGRGVRGNYTKPTSTFKHRQRATLLVFTLVFNALWWSTAVRTPQESADFNGWKHLECSSYGTQLRTQHQTTQGSWVTAFC